MRRIVAIAPPRFGVWANVNGSWASFHHPEDPPDASWLRNKALVLEAEALGFATTLVAQQTINPWNEEYGQLEAWSASAALAAVSRRIEIITAIKPALQHPVVFAKQALQMHEISEGRTAINLVNGWFKTEMARAGLTMREHDERYAYGREWITVVKRLLAGQRVSFEGRYFNIDGYQLRPGPWQGQPPRVYFGGESEPARALAADAADTFFINGRPLPEVRSLISDLAARSRRGAAPLRFAIAAFVIARPTQQEADEAFQAALALAALDAPDLRSMSEASDPAVVMRRVQQQYGPRVGTNGGTAAGLVGSYDQVAERIAAFHEAGIGTFMLQFQPFEAEMRRFASEIFPRVERIVARAA